jgi:hypothetical protein
MADLAQVESALRKAHAAGDVDGARRLASAYKTMQAQQPAVDTPSMTQSAPVAESATPIETPQRVNKLVLPEKTVQPLSRFDRVLKGMRDPIDAGAQLITKALPEGYLDAADKKLYDVTGGILGAPAGAMQQISDAESEYQARREAGGESGIDAYRIAGNVVSPANLAIASKIPVATTLGGNILTGAGAGGIFGALTPTTQGDENFAKEKATQIGLGVLTGGAIPAATAGIGRVISPNASTNAQLSLLQKEGVKPTIGQALGGRANALEEKAMSVPIMGDMISVARSKSAEGVQRAAYNRALTPIGEKLPKGMKGRDAVAYTSDRLSQKYDEVLNKIGAITPDEQFTQSVDDLTKMVDVLKVPKAEKAKFALALDDVRNSIDENGVLTSEAYKTLESSLGSDFRKLSSSQSVTESRIAPAVKQLQQNLKDMLQRQAGSNADELQKANAAYANFKRVQNAAGKSGAIEGEFTPAQLGQAVRAMDKSKDKGQYAKGNALMQDLSDAARAVVGDKVPNSGTAERLLYGGGALGSGLVNPAIPMALAGGATAYTAPVQNALVSLVTKRPEFAKALASEVNKLGVSKGAQTVPAMIAARQE